MKLGATIDPNPALVGEDPPEFGFVEPALNARDCRVADFDATVFREKLDAAGLDCTVHLPHFPHMATTVPEIDETLRQYHDRALAKVEPLNVVVGVCLDASFIPRW